MITFDGWVIVLLYMFARQLLFMLACAFAAGALCVWLIPKLWMWVKPFLHALTS